MILLYINIPFNHQFYSFGQVTYLIQCEIKVKVLIAFGLSFSYSILNDRYIIHRFRFIPFKYLGIHQLLYSFELKIGLKFGLKLNEAIQLLYEPWLERPTRLFVT